MHNVPLDYELVQRPGLVAVYRNIKTNKYHYHDGVSLSSDGRDSIDEAVELFKQDAAAKSKD